MSDCFFAALLCNMTCHVIKVKMLKKKFSPPSPFLLFRLRQPAVPTFFRPNLLSVNYLLALQLVERKCASAGWLLLSCLDCSRHVWKVDDSLHHYFTYARQYDQIILLAVWITTDKLQSEMRVTAKFDQCACVCGAL